MIPWVSLIGTQGYLRYKNDLQTFLGISDYDPYSYQSPLMLTNFHIALGAMGISMITRRERNLSSISRGPWSSSPVSSRAP